MIPASGPHTCCCRAQQQAACAHPAAEQDHLQAQLQKAQQQEQRQGGELQQAQQRFAAVRLEVRRLAAQAGAAGATWQEGGPGPGRPLLHCFRVRPEVAAGSKAGLPLMHGALAGLAAIAGERCSVSCAPRPSLTIPSY
jgi:hypothetical protein